MEKGQLRWNFSAISQVFKIFEIFNILNVQFKNHAMEIVPIIVYLKKSKQN